MKILVVGSGGREHALCWAFKKSRSVERVYCADGNAGIEQLAERVPIRPDDVKGLVEFACTNAVDLTFVGGEISLALGIVDEFESRGLKIIGPKLQAARLESSKSFAKDFMSRHGIPTAKYVVASSPDLALLELESGIFGGPDTPIVVKADGLAAGKGVVVATSHAEAETAIKGMVDAVGTAAASTIVLEECLTGPEISLLAFVSDADFALMPASRDHKRLSDGDTGPNTGGMGAVTHPSFLTAEQLDEITQTIIKPTLHGCVKEGLGFRGILFIGLMMTASGPRVLEYNVRFGDPETQAILVRLETDLVDICEAMLDGRLKDLEIKWRTGSSACVVLASEGYPAKPRSGDAIDGLDAPPADHVETFHAGTSRSSDGQFITNGGRVLGITATGDDLESALAAAYSTAQKISWPGIQYRRDIGK